MTIRVEKEGAVAKFKRKAFVIRSIQDMSDTSASGAAMHRVLGALDLVLLGIGCIIGAGIMVLTGVAANKYAGPGVVVSYSMAAVAAMLTSLCYAEFAADLPVAGGAFNYIGLTFGEFAAWVAACDLILEYTLSAAAVAKGFTSYFASLIGMDADTLRLKFGDFELDFPALASVVVCSMILARSTKESSLLNSISVVAHILLIVFVFCAGFPNVQSENYTPFLPFGIRGCFTGASVVFFSFIGFDTVSTAAEEVKNPGRDLPIGIVGSLSICTVLYVLMCVVITGMVPYDQIDIDAPFSVAFRQAGLGWADKIVSFGALTGILTSLLGSLLGQARIYVTLGRQYLLPPWLARVDPGSGTPRNATLLTMCTAGVLAVFFDIELLSELVSIGTLVVFTMVNAGVVFRRYYVRSAGEPMQPVGFRVIAIIAASLAFSISFTEKAPWPVYALFLVAWAGATASFYRLPVCYVPTVFSCPLHPWVPSAGMLCCIHLIGSLGWLAYVRWVIWFSIGTCVYLAYSMHNSQGEGKARLAQRGGMELQSLPSGQASENSDSWLLVGNGVDSAGPPVGGSTTAKEPVGGAAWGTGEAMRKSAGNDTVPHDPHRIVPSHGKGRGKGGRASHSPGSSPPPTNPGEEEQDFDDRPLQARDSSISDSAAHRRHHTPPRITSEDANKSLLDADSLGTYESSSAPGAGGALQPPNLRMLSQQSSPHGSPRARGLSKSGSASRFS